MEEGLCEVGSACYVNKQGPSFPGCLSKKKKKKNQRACVLSAVAPASEEGSQRTCNPGKLDGCPKTLKENAARAELREWPEALGFLKRTRTRVGTTLRPRLAVEEAHESNPRH